ncbi:hypothetical protein B566_EDAN009471 [Ephemera danica]|nr:hypothetical protein B566_EDAN009471 [Ephemera danica]
MFTCKHVLLLVIFSASTSLVLAESGSDIQNWISANAESLKLIGLDATQIDASNIDSAQISSMRSQIGNLPSNVQGVASDLLNGKVPSNLVGQNASEILGQLEASQLIEVAAKAQEIAQNSGVTLPPGVALPDEQKISEALGSDAVKNAISGLTVSDSIPAAIGTKKKSTTN